MEEMDLTELYQSYSRIGKNHATPKQMLKILIYAYMHRIYSSRQIELACRRQKSYLRSKYFQQKRAETLANITSSEGIILRTNRSIQSDMDFK